MSKQQESGKKGCAKAGRNRFHGQMYRTRGRRIRNKVVRLLTTLRRQPDNWQALNILSGYVNRKDETIISVTDGFRAYNQRVPHQQANIKSFTS